MKLIRIIYIILFFILFYFQNSYSQNYRNMEVIIRSEEGNIISHYEKSYALVVGISNYTRGWKNLPNAIKDAYRVKDVLQRRHGFFVQVIEDPTKNQLLNVLETFMFKYGISVNNRLLFYFAGHGYSMKMPHGKLGYIVPSDAPTPKFRAEFMKKAISMEEFKSKTYQIQAKHVLYVFDSCFSGSIFATMRDHAPPPSRITQRISVPVRQFITAGNENEKVPDISIFTEQFIEALNGNSHADSWPDGYLTGEELGLFLKNSVEEYSNNTQHPQYGKIRDPNLDKGDFVFVTKKPESVFWGEIHVRTKPWCHVFVDGVEKGISPSIIKNISIGNHVITLKRNGYKEKVKKIVVSKENRRIKISEILINK
jgi:hypothetical protein